MERKELTPLRTQDVAIAELATLYMPLKIDGINDKAGFDAVHKARMIVKGKRVEVEKLRKELKADAIEYGRQVDAEAKRITGMIEPIEDHLEAQEKAVIDEKERIRKAAEDAKRKIIEDRVQALCALGALPNLIEVAGFTEGQFQAALKVAQDAKDERDRLAEAERQRVAAEAEARRLEAAAMAAERAELDKIRKQQEEQAAQLRAAQAKMEAEAAAARRAMELEAARKEAAERARLETERRLAEQTAREKAEAEQAKIRAEREAAERQEAEAAKPYRIKLKNFARELEALQVPDGPKFGEVSDIVSRAARDIRAIAEGPMPRAKKREALAV